MKDYESIFRKAIQVDTPEGLGKIALEAFEDPTTDENTLEWIAGNVFERNVRNAFGVIPKFVDRFPDSLGLPRIFLAQLCENEQPDDCTELARYYLRAAKNRDLFDKLGDMNVIRAGVSRAFLLVPAAYKSVGALTYSIRVLSLGLKLKIQDDLRRLFQEDIDKLSNELRQSAAVQSVNNQWETFFSTGRGANDLYERCKKFGFENLAKRIDLIEGQFRFNSLFKVTDDELFLLVHQTSDGAFILA